MMTPDEKYVFWEAVWEGILEVAFFMACMSATTYFLIQILRLFE